MAQEKKGGKRKQSHLPAPAEKSIKANAYGNICRGHNRPIFRVLEKQSARLALMEILYVTI